MKKYFIIVIIICLTFLSFLLMSKKEVKLKEETKIVNNKKNNDKQTLKDDTILSKSENKDDNYINDTLFLGDSNTAGFLKVLNSNNKPYVSKENSIGVVGMGVDAISTLKCLEIENDKITMVKAVSLIQPRRIIITFGTNNLSSKLNGKQFKEKYLKQLNNIKKEYEYADIIVNAIPPITKNTIYKNINIKQIDEYNEEIIKMCKENGFKFLNSSEVLKDKTGYAKEEYMLKDGLHFSKKGIETLFNYINSHQYISADRRLKPLKKVPKIIGVSNGLIKTNPLTQKSFSEDEYIKDVISKCGENAFSKDDSCFCNEGYEGDAFIGCTLKVQESIKPTQTPLCNEEAKYDERLNACICIDENKIIKNDRCVLKQEPTLTPEITPTPTEKIDTEVKPTQTPESTPEAIPEEPKKEEPKQEEDSNNEVKPEDNIENNQEEQNKDSSEG